MEKKTKVWENGLIWFGAGVSLAEILSGTLLAPLGFSQGLTAIILGHVIGCLLLFGAGLIGGRTGKSAMETVRISFGLKGAKLFAGLNVLQLVGWTAVMIAAGAAAMTALIPSAPALWCVVIGLIIAVWIWIGIAHAGKLNVAAMALLFILTLVLSTLVFKGQLGPAAAADPLSFGAAVELSVAMPLSWLPLLSDYTRSAERPLAATAASCVVYGLVSCWMYVIGLGAALFTGGSDVGTIMLKAGLGVGAILIVLLSTATTTYLDVYSAAVSSVSMKPSLKEKPAALVVCLAGTVLAALAPTAQFENFLYLIGSIFAPMTAVLLTDYYLLGRDHSGSAFSRSNILLWAVGMILYRYFLTVDTPLGCTIPVMVIMILLCYILGKFKGGNTHASGNAGKRQD